MPLDLSPPIATRFGPRRWLASVGLVIGAVLAAVGLFLPWVRVAYPAVAGDPASSFTVTPGPTFGEYVGGLVTAPYRFSISLTLLSLLFFGVPLFFAIVGALVLLRRGWLPARRTRRASLALAVIATVTTLLTAAFVVFYSGEFDAVLPTRTPQPGAAVTMLGHLCALVALVELPSRP